MAEPSSSASKDDATTRLAFLDPIRVGLTLLVILHHLSITYGGSGSWYYKEAGATELTRLLLTVFNATNQSFFMGFFFLISGYLMPQGLARKGTSTYVGDRLYRLGLPMLLFGFLLAPLTRALVDGAQGGEFMVSLLPQIVRGDFDLGPLWFNLALLIGTAVWVLTPRLTPLERLMDRIPASRWRRSPGPHWPFSCASRCQSGRTSSDCSSATSPPTSSCSSAAPGRRNTGCSNRCRDATPCPGSSSA